MNTHRAATRLARVLTSAALAGAAFTVAGLTGPHTAQAQPSALSHSATEAHGTPLAAGWPVVKHGQRSANVTTVQRLLTARGYRLTADGVFGAATTNAVKAFQRSQHLAADGTVGPKTWTALVITVRSANRGPAVTAVQQLLRSHGHPTTTDGVFGPATTNAVKAFQRSQHLAADGTVGPNSWRALVKPVNTGYYLQFSKNPSTPIDSVLSIVRNGTVVKKYQAGAGITTNTCASQKGWLPDGTYQIKGHQKNRNSTIKGYAIQLSDKRCSPGGTLRNALFIHSEMTKNGGRGSTEATRWDGSGDYKSLGCIKLAPNDIKDLFARLDRSGWPKTLRVDF
ncbi:peptidoglycan-binding protein [Actinacidiphila glaucinigra]|uniref:peptidoglycan-binding protein n=1 Tax=Actinacidiphila glaucinigra TaxID=235986 RepID=UPI0037C9C97F